MSSFALVIAVPLATAALIGALGKRVPAVVIQALAIATPCAVLAVLAAAAVHGSFTSWLGGWTPRNGLAIGIALDADPLTLAAAAFAAVIVLASLIYATGHFEEVHGLFHPLTLLLFAGMEGFVVAGDIFTQFVFFELMGMAAFALTGLHADERGPVQGSMTFTVTNGLAGTLFLFGIALLYARTGALNMAQLRGELVDEPLVVASFACIAVALLVKSSCVPFHFWLGDAHATAPAPSSAVFSGAMVPLASIVLLRDWFSIFRGALHDDAVRITLVAIGALTVVIGGATCILQRHLKRLLAFSTITHMGVVVAAAGLFDERATAGLVLYACAQGLSKAALFLYCGGLVNRHGSLSIDDLHGKGKRDFALLAVFASASLAVAGFPLFATSFADHLVEKSAPWLFAVPFIASVTTGAALASATARIFFGAGSREHDDGDQGESGGEEHADWPKMGAARHAVAVGACLVVAAAVVGFIGVREAYDAAFALMHPPPADAVLAGAEVHATVTAAHIEERDVVEEWPELCALACALAIGACVVWLRRPRWLQKPVEILERFHSGDVRDDVTWLMVGLAIVLTTWLFAR